MSPNEKSTCLSKEKQVLFFCCGLLNPDYLRLLP